MLWTIIVILVILWLLGFLGRNISPRFPQTGGWIHMLIVIAASHIAPPWGVVNLLRFDDKIGLFNQDPVRSLALMSMLQFQTGGSVGIEIAVTSKRKILRTSLDRSS